MKRAMLLAIPVVLALAIGAGAFTRVSAPRDADVEVVNDSNAYLAISQIGTPNSVFGRADTSQGTKYLDFNHASGIDGLGVGLHSVYNFDEVLEVTNKSTQTVHFYATFSDLTDEDQIDHVWVYPAADGFKNLTGADYFYELDPGESFRIGVHIDTDGGGVPGYPGSLANEFLGTIHINATVPEPSGIQLSD